MSKFLATHSPEHIIGGVTPPPSIRDIAGQTGADKLSTVLSNIVQIIFVFGAIATVFMLIMGAVQLILSGGDKEKVAQARSRITFAIIGIVLLALAFIILNVISIITGFSLFGGAGSMQRGECIDYDGTRVCI